MDGDVKIPALREESRVDGGGGGRGGVVDPREVGVVREVPGGDKAVTAVVAGAAEDGDVRVCGGGVGFEDGLGDGEASEFHELVEGEVGEEVRVQGGGGLRGEVAGYGHFGWGKEEVLVCSVGELRAGKGGSWEGGEELEARDADDVVR